ncbi:MAG: hypothetical protein U9Q82_15900 [Chloroflexota bacterium]|nr:hypothetical protein [Chloroflexota bacterium]
MKAIHYDAEGDILSVTFAETQEQRHTGLELSDNIVLYYNPETEKPLKLVLLSYSALLQTSAETPILLDGLARAPVNVQATVIALLQRTPLTVFMQTVESHGQTPLTSQLYNIFTPNAVQTIAA